MSADPNTAAAAAVQRAPRDWAWAVSTLLGIGHLRPGPGTWASAVTVLLWWLLASRLSSAPAWILPAAIAWTVAATLIGIAAATREARRCGLHDPSHVVIDEMAGQM